jgi:hypothetical protein
MRGDHYGRKAGIGQSLRMAGEAEANTERCCAETGDDP